MGKVRFITWNMHEAGTREKRLSIFKQLSRLREDVAFLQEAHKSAATANDFKSPEFPVFSACYNSQQ